MPVRRHRSAAIPIVVAVAVLLSTTGGASAKSSPPPTAPTIVFSGENNNLNAYSPTPPFVKQRVMTTHDYDPKGLDINAQICVWRGPKGRTRLIAGEDTGQPNPPQGWGIFDLRGTRIGNLSIREVGKLTPTYQGSLDNAENYGCGHLKDGRLLTTDVGDQATGPPNGQLIVWFPPFESRTVRYCKLDVAIGTAQSIHVDDEDRIYVASARGDRAGVLRYTGPFPTGDDAAHGCGKKDATAAPLADQVNVETFIKAGDHDLATPAGIAVGKDKHFFVSSVFTGVINEYDADGAYVRTVLRPPAGEQLGAHSYSTGTPLGIGIGPDGSLYYADIGVVVEPGKLPGPGDSNGTVRRIAFVHGRPQAPRLVDTGLGFPDGIGVWVPPR
ncbi:MAG: hypothetical protein U0V73_16480 [Acidimicrobiia bacterium]